MDHHKWFFLIILFVIVPCFSVAGELIIHSSEGVETLTIPDSGPSNTQPDKYKKIGEKCIQNCDEEKAISKSPSKLPIKKDIKKSEVISFRTFDVDHSEVRGIATGGVVTPGGVVTGGIVLAKVIPKIERCAYVVFRNNWGGQRLIREWDFKATFANGATQEGMTIGTNSYSIQEGETGTANICFGINDYPIVRMDCDF